MRPKKSRREEFGQGQFGNLLEQENIVFSSDILDLSIEVGELSRVQN
jgi:hypothetical protein